MIVGIISVRDWFENRGTFEVGEMFKSHFVRKVEGEQKK